MGLDSRPTDSRSPHFPSPNSQALSFKKCPDVAIQSVADNWPSRSFLPYLPSMELPRFFPPNLGIYTSVCFQNSDAAKDHL